jgi:hypothetical protein
MLDSVGVVPLRKLVANGADEMTPTMARQRKDTPAGGAGGSDDLDITTLKTYKRVAKKLAQVGALLNLSQQEVLARYEDTIDEDLLELLAKRQSELTKKRPPAG